jgi:hypothetical protein
MTPINRGVEVNRLLWQKWADRLPPEEERAFKQVSVDS